MRAWGLSALVAILLLTGVSPAVASATPLVPVSPGARVLTQPPIDAVPADFGVVPGLVDTQIHWTRWNRYVVYGGRTVLEGQVVTDDGALPGAAVDLYARRAGSGRWHPVGTTTSSSDTAVFRFDEHEPSRTTDYRVVFEGDVMYARTEDTKGVPVRRRVPDRMRRVDATHYTFRGSVEPRYRERRVRLQRKTCRRCAWDTLATRRTTRRSRWRFRVSAPDKRGTWYYRAVVPRDRHFARSYSEHVWAVRRR